ncbi:MAG: ABC transporter ATP-binding protein [Firmicutes bacterium]|nr:ABC transporter ATP-binding protein [Bacillota bacterium]
MEPIVQMKGIGKVFPGVVANDGIDLEIIPGEIHTLLGENGAGKTTLMNVLYGLYQPDAGEIYLRGRRVAIGDPNVAIALGIGMVHQHFMLIPPFTVAENIVLGDEPRKGRVFIDMKKAIRDVEAISEKYGLKVDPLARVENISVSMQQRVEILKALHRGAEILILDEPTAVLIPQEVRELKMITDNLAAQGKAIIFITHKLKEVMAMSHRITVIRRGKVAGSVNPQETTPAALASMMVGREVLLQVEKGPASPGETLLSVENLEAVNNRKLPALRGISFELRAGEILGIAGVDGNGQSELVEVITGLRKANGGRLQIKGRDMTNKGPRQMAEAGVAHIPEDRQKRGLILDFNVAENLILGSYFKRPFARGINLRYDRVYSHARELIKEFDVRTPHEKTPAKSLSGGNQQKVILAREFDMSPEILVAAQPTRGLDVGAIEFVHHRLVEQRDKGKAILLVSLELDEILSLSDRIAVMYGGKIVGMVDAADADEEELGLMMAGGGQRDEGESAALRGATRNA